VMRWRQVEATTDQCRWIPLLYSGPVCERSFLIRFCGYIHV
jgi:hypothetical protein